MSYFKIELLSDLCASNGESFGSVIDTDIAFDSFGLPVIKGKSLKGCLRECAEELYDLGLADSTFIDEVFGVKGNTSSGNLMIQDAHPANYSELIKDISENVLLHENVMNCYTYTRGQTSINDDGIAKDGSLRTIRVLEKNHTFICEYSLDEKYRNIFHKCLTLLRHIGLNRTRGLGEIKCTPLNGADFLKSDIQKSSNNISDYDYLEYTFETISPLISSDSNENTDYIPGSAMMGLCFNKIGNDTMKGWLNSQLVFTNAYISDNEKAFYPNPAFMAKQKEAAFNSENKMPVYIFDTEKCNNASPPALPVKGMNISADTDFSTVSSISVRHEINYHHQQSQDNPGIIYGENFYQLSSISPGQKFRGKIYGSKQQLSEIKEAFSETEYVNIGYYRSGGYGKCRLEIIEKSSLQQTSSDCIAIWLHSSAVMYDDNGMPCAKPEVFVKYFNSLLRHSKTDARITGITHKYLKYANAGGYNVTWGMNKSVFQTYAGGTVFVLKLSERIDLDLLKYKMLGERTSEGYGEFQIFDYNNIIKNEHPVVSKVSFIPSVQQVYEYSNEYSWKLPSDIIEQNRKITGVQLIAIEKACDRHFKINSAQVGRLLLMLKESNSYSDFLKSIDNIKDNNRKEAAKKIVQLPDGVNDDMYKEYFRLLLTLKKYDLRKEEKADAK